MVLICIIGTTRQASLLWLGSRGKHPDPGAQRTVCSPAPRPLSCMTGRCSVFACRSVTQPVATTIHPTPLPHEPKSPRHGSTDAVGTRVYSTPYSRETYRLCILCCKRNAGCLSVVSAGSGVPRILLHLRLETDGSFDRHHATIRLWMDEGETRPGIIR
jgi:hypothetical protein